MIRQCIDRYVDGTLAVKAAKLAIAENPENSARYFASAFAITPMPGDVPDKVSLALITGKKWARDRVLIVAFLDGTADAKKKVQEAAERWYPYMSVRFKFVSGVQGEIRISFRGVGAWSYMGTDNLAIARVQPTMNFGFLEPGTAEHEFGHALGCIHEHQQPKSAIPWNKEAVYRYFGGPPNNWSRQEVDSQIFGKYSAGLTQFSEYDPKSIMHYPIDPSLLIDPRAAVGWNSVLSAMDKSFIAEMYPPVVAPPPPPPEVVEITIPKAGKYRLV